MLFYAFAGCEKKDLSENQDSLRPVYDIADFEYVMYSDIINDIFDDTFDSNSVIIIKKETQNNVFPIYNNQEYLDYLQNEFTGLDNTCIEDFLKQNEKEYYFADKFPVNEHTIKIISQEEITSFFNNSSDDDNSWESFCEAYPNSFGYFSFTRIGFNSGFDQAIVGMDHFSENPKLKVYLIYLQKNEDNNWEISKVLNSD